MKNLNKKIKKIDIEFSEGNNSFLTQEMVNKLLIQNHDTLKNQPKSVIDLQELEQTVLLNPYVENATVFYTIDGVLKAKVKQRTPIARFYANDSSYYIDNKGFKFPLSENYSARVILITGAVDVENLQEFTKFVNEISADNFLKKEIIGIHKTQEKEFILSVRSGSYKIEFGSLEEMKIKFRKLKAFYNKAFVDKTINQYKIINLKYHNQVVCAK
ncbi:MAG: cell division protein FtsQ/DivIB [Polaribacter sp.]|nr:cell division protein FtsQ/DivIB [Polaribacter sp.]MDG1811669.1 cell division protein FtsQ/DivIB [Polaribacter sp.]MDG1994077.1 cell division protein FtsQ/DivIB [Polaribacter sp.]